VKTAAKILVTFVAFEHLMFLVLEMFLWNTPFGHRTFNLTPQFAEQSAVLAANQGLYNGLLAVGLIWSLVSAVDARNKRLFFLSCVVVAGIYGGVTAKVSILFMQALPAALAIAAVYLAGDESSASAPA
jgi:putative membrane protein